MEHMKLDTISSRRCFPAIAVTLTAALSAVAMAQSAPEAGGSPPVSTALLTQPGDQLVPFGFVFGRTTKDEALATWSAADALVTGRAHAAVGKGGVDGLSTLQVERIFLVDVHAVPFFGTRPARFAFLDDELYSVQTVLSRTLVPSRRGDNSQSLSPEEIKTLQTDLRRRFGAPTRTARSLMASKEPDIFEWKLGARTLMLTTNAVLGATLTLTDPVLAKKAKQANDEECKQYVACAGYGRNRR